MLFRSGGRCDEPAGAELQRRNVEHVRLREPMADGHPEPGLRCSPGPRAVELAPQSRCLHDAARPEEALPRQTSSQRRSYCCYAVREDWESSQLRKTTLKLRHSESMKSTSYDAYTQKLGRGGGIRTHIRCSKIQHLRPKSVRGVFAGSLSCRSTR